MSIALLTEFKFLAALALVVWAYAGYPVFLVLLARLRSQRIAAAPIEPSVTMVIAAYNEERHIGSKLENMLALDWPREKLQLIVASDCSTDRTHDLVRGFADRGVELVILPTRGGKTAAQNLAVQSARGEVIVFTDATTEFLPGTLRELLQPMADPRVGCVGAELDYESAQGTEVGKGAGAYWRYEKWIKSLEGRVGSLIGVSGCLYAVRRALYRPIDADLISDFVIASDVFEQGYLTVYGRGAVSREATNEDDGREFDMRVRVAVRSINALVRRRRMLNPFRFGLFSFQLLCHKVLRYAVPELLLVAGVTHVALVAMQVRPALYGPLLGAHLAVYALAALGWLSLRRGWRLPGIHIPFYFMTVNAAALWAFVLYLRGERKVTWNTVR